MRKRYLVWALALAAIGVAGCQASQPAPAPSTPGSTAGGLTVGTTEGPYYISGTRELKDGKLDYTGLPGDPVRISGGVYSGVGTSTPISGAKVEIWQADGQGAYHPASNGAASAYPVDQLALRGYVLADKDGRYAFTTIYPGYYPGRTRHIHVRASAPGYGGVVTQLIVPSRAGDGTTPQTDAIAQSLPPANYVTFASGGPVPAGAFDFHLGRD